MKWISSHRCPVSYVTLRSSCCHLSYTICSKVLGGDMVPRVNCLLRFEELDGIQPTGESRKPIDGQWYGHGEWWHLNIVSISFLFLRHVADDAWFVFWLVRNFYIWPLLLPEIRSHFLNFTPSLLGDRFRALTVLGSLSPCQMTVLLDGICITGRLCVVRLDGSVHVNGSLTMRRCLYVLLQLSSGQGPILLELKRTIPKHWYWCSLGTYFTTSTK